MVCQRKLAPIAFIWTNLVPKSNLSTLQVFAHVSGEAFQSRDESRCGETNIHTHCRSDKGLDTRLAYVYRVLATLKPPSKPLLEPPTA